MENLNEKYEIKRRALWAAYLAVVKPAELKAKKEIDSLEQREEEGEISWDEMCSRSKPIEDELADIRLTALWKFKNHNDQNIRETTPKEK